MNTSSAVMQQRTEPKDSLDDFPTPPWATRAICELLPIRPDDVCREPTANRGHMVKPLSEYFYYVHASDIHDYGAGFPVYDYLCGEPTGPTDWLITNPPFNKAEQFIRKALTETTVGVALILRSSFAESVGRYTRLFNVTPPTTIYQFSERVPMFKGTVSNKGSRPTSYAWFVWEHSKRGQPTEFKWIAPCRKRLEKDSDYDV